MKDKKQLTQMIILGVLVAFVVGYAVFKMTGTKTSAAPPAAQSEEESMNQEPQANVTDEMLLEDDSVALVSDDEMEAATLRDPFIPAMAEVDETVRAQQSINNVRLAQSMAAFDRNLPMIPPMPIDGVQRLPQERAQAATPEEEPFPAFVVTGIVTGEDSVAIIRLDEGRYIVKKGQKINGVYEVVSVSQAGVVLRRGDQSVILRLGGDGNANQN